MVWCSPRSSSFAVAKLRERPSHRDRVFALRRATKRLMGLHDHALASSAERTPLRGEDVRVELPAACA
jgi:hypothetical protein